MVEHVRLVEVGPRDGLQNEAVFIDTATKLELIGRLAACGLSAIEVTACVSPQWVPQMADHGEVLAALPALPGIDLPVLVPNLRGAELAIAAGARELAVFAAASESFSQRNINCSIAQSLARFTPVLALAASRGVRVRGYVSCVVGCPYEGAVAPAAVARVAGALHAAGCYQVSLGDTIGTGTPDQVAAMLDQVARVVAIEHLAGHFHDTYGMAVANVHAAFRHGLRVFDSSVAGLGGCPYARGASGNVATEELVWLFAGLGVETGVDLDALARTGDWISARLGRANASRVGRALLARSTMVTGGCGS